jgi:predicted GNAT family acetyltransferase
VFACGLDHAGQVCATVLRVPPFPMIATELDPSCAVALVSGWLALDPELPAVNGLPQSARAVAAAWAQLTGGRTRVRMREAMHALTEVLDPPRPAAGGLRLADAGEHELLTTWFRDFTLEAGVEGADYAAAMVDRHLERGTLCVWEDGRPVSLVARSVTVAAVSRIGPVYTPPELRGRGYASSAVAAMSRQALDEGASRCMLFTDLANPTSNKIYADVGYRPIGEWEEHALEPG